MKDFLQVVVFVGAFLILFLPIVVSDSMYFPFITGKNFYFRILVEIIFASWAILAILDARFRPRFSWILVAAGSLIAVMLVANLQGYYLPKSFWSNFERMDGYVTLVHFFLYFVVLGSILRNQTIDFLGFKTTTWHLFFGTAMIAASWVALTAFRQLAGDVEITQGGLRITGTLGNAAYMAIYMLFNTFIAVWLIVTTKNTWWRAILGCLALVFIYLLIQTATRGTIVGLAGGVFLSATYIAVFNTAYPQARKWSIGILAVLILAVGGLYVARDSQFVDTNPILDRATQINLSELTLRTQIWGMALEGVKDRPILGWGQGNFSYIFNREYIPEIYYAEQWYDRAHNVFLDWLVAGGVIGLLAYLSIFVAAMYYIVVQPWRRKEEEVFSVTERGLLLGIFAAYFTHNLVVFDNIVSFIFFAVILALVHSRVSTPIQKLQSYRPAPMLVTQMVAPIVLAATLLIVYFVNIPAMYTAKDMIKALTNSDPEIRLSYFEQALDRDTFGTQEVTEQLLRQAIDAHTDQAVPPAATSAIIESAEKAMQDMIAQKPNDARLHVLFGGFYRTVGSPENAIEQLAIARSLSPNKPSIVVEQGIAAYQAGDVVAAERFMKAAYELETTNPNAQILYGALLVNNDKSEVAREIVTEDNWEAFAQNDFVFSVANQANDYELLTDIFAVRIKEDPTDAQLRASLAFVHYRNENIPAAIQTIEAAREAIPAFATVGQCYIDNLSAGNQPDAGC